VVYETPNRLNCFDWHSFLLPFFDSLPDGLAIAYADHSPRPFFKIHPEGNLVENLYRLGRGVSFHEFDLALGLEQLRAINDGFSSKLAHRSSLEHEPFDLGLLDIFERYLPMVPQGFARPSLDLVIQKPDGACISPQPRRRVPGLLDTLRRRCDESERR